LAWHDNQVMNNDLTEAYISWFFTLAHEIAHNLVSQHDSEHEVSGGGGGILLYFPI
jgi:hypothetical protein